MDNPGTHLLASQDLSVALTGKVLAAIDSLDGMTAVMLGLRG